MTDEYLDLLLNYIKDSHNRLVTARRLENLTYKKKIIPFSEYNQMILEFLRLNFVSYNSDKSLVQLTKRGLEFKSFKHYKRQEKFNSYWNPRITLFFVVITAALVLIQVFLEYLPKDEPKPPNKVLLILDTLETKLDSIKESLNLLKLKTDTLLKTK